MKTPMSSEFFLNGFCRRRTPPPDDRPRGTYRAPSGFYRSCQLSPITDSPKSMRIQNSIRLAKVREYGFTFCEPADEEFDVEELGCILPPLPAPNLKQMRTEASGGASLVLCLVITFVTITLACGSSARLEQTRLTLYTLILVEAAVAIAALLHLMLGDPGVVRRSRGTCLPVPPEVVERLNANFVSSGGDHPNPLGGLRNISDGDRTYCVRCCVWRQGMARNGRGLQLLGASSQTAVLVHHCSICQRCVRNFDHHCGVFGRCIAGTATTGNMPAFVLLISMAYAGFFTCVAAVVAAFNVF